MIVARARTHNASHSTDRCAHSVAMATFFIALLSAIIAVCEAAQVAPDGGLVFNNVNAVVRNGMLHDRKLAAE